MTILLLVALALVVWAWRKGQLRRLRFGDVAAVAVALIGLGLLRRGEAGPALLALAGPAFWIWRRTWLARRARRIGQGAQARPAGRAERKARDLLELPRHADEAMIRAAHRRLIARVHPDAGGTAELARRVNQARDILLARLAATGEPDRPAGVPRRS